MTIALPTYPWNDGKGEEGWLDGIDATLDAWMYDIPDGLGEHMPMDDPDSTWQELLEELAKDGADLTPEQQVVVRRIFDRVWISWGLPLGFPARSSPVPGGWDESASRISGSEANHRLGHDAFPPDAEVVTHTGPVVVDHVQLLKRDEGPRYLLFEDGLTARGQVDLGDRYPSVLAVRGDLRATIFKVRPTWAGSLVVTGRIAGADWIYAEPMPGRLVQPPGAGLDWDRVEVPWAVTWNAPQARYEYRELREGAMRPIPSDRLHPDLPVSGPDSQDVIWSIVINHQVYRDHRS